MNIPAKQRSIRETVEDYDTRRAGLADALAAHEAAKDAVKSLCTIGGEFVGSPFGGNEHISVKHMEATLLESAWRHVYRFLNIPTIASATDKKRFDMALQDPPEFTLGNISATFGDYVIRPRFHILKGLAETFATLDPAYKSHSKVKVGVAGLPKRIIVTGVGGYGHYGKDRLRDIVDAVLAVRGLPLVDGSLYGLHGDAMKEPVEKWDMTFKAFSNGNLHVHFGKDSLIAINRGLSEFYGDVLPDEAGEKPTEKQASTAVSKDLQYYPTPQAVVDQVLDWAHVREGELVLEPSCGCGRIMDAVRKKGAKVWGVEFDNGRAQECREKGHKVTVGNFLEQPDVAQFDAVIMNPPFAGKHYQKHIRHAMKFLKPRGELTAILPATAMYDHGFVKEIGAQWRDLPVASFAESGTNVPTGVLKWRNT